MKKWVERAAIITGTLGFIGVVIIFFMTINERLNNNEKQLSEKSKQVDSSKPVKIDTIAKEKISITQPDTVALPPKEKVIDTKRIESIPTEPKTIVKKEPKDVPVKKEKIVQKLLSKEELQDLYGAIRNRRTVSSNTQNCVKLYFVEGSNNVKAVKQVERYLKSKKLIITGRETVEKSRKGIYIKSTGSCIGVTIGKL